MELKMIGIMILVCLFVSIFVSICVGTLFEMYVPKKRLANKIIVDGEEINMKSVMVLSQLNKFKGSNNIRTFTFKTLEDAPTVFYEDKEEEKVKEI